MWSQQTGSLLQKNTSTSFSSQPKEASKSSLTWMHDFVRRRDALLAASWTVLCSFWIERPTSSRPGTPPYKSTFPSPPLLKVQALQNAAGARATFLETPDQVSSMKWNPKHLVLAYNGSFLEGGRMGRSFGNISIYAPKVAWDKGLASDV